MASQYTADIERFFTQFKQQHYRKGEILVRADEDPSGIFYLRDGTVKQYLISKKGDESVVNLYKAGAFFPMSWAINNTPNIYYYEAVTECDIWRAPKEQAVDFVKHNPDILFDLMSRVYKGIDGVLLRMAYLMSGSAYARLITELIIQAKRFSNEAANGSCELKTTESNLAMQAGMSRETVSREMKHLKGKGLVELNKNNIIIPDLEKLELELAETS